MTSPLARQLVTLKSAEGVPKRAAGPHPLHLRVAHSPSQAEGLRQEHRPPQRSHTGQGSACTSSRVAPRGVALTLADAMVW